MKKRFALGLTLALLLQALPLSVFGQEAKEDNSLSEKQTIQVSESKPKLAPDLAEETDAVRFGEQEDKTQRVIVQLSERKAEQLRTESFGTPSEISGKKPVGKAGILMSDFVEPSDTEEPSDDEKDGILMGDFVAHDEMETKMQAYQGSVKKTFDTMGLMVVDLPLSKVREMANDPDVVYVSPDRVVKSAGHLEKTTAASTIRNLVSGTTIDGRGVSIAVLDSGIDESHWTIKANGNHPGVVDKVSYTGADAIKDKYGHGTHVASIAAGGSYLKSGAYTGVAPGAKLISLQVLDANGNGTISNAIAAIDWCIANKNKNSYNIKVINISFGSVAHDSYVNDPLCKAARRAVNAGIVVVASAGNNGKNSQGQKLYGGISSPGIEPSVITVGATNSYGTDARLDDAVTTFSSRGPTRGYTIVNGVKKFDNLIKPDLVAPGNKLIGGCSSNPDQSQDKKNNLVINNPALLASNTSVYEDRVMYMSGSSVAAPQVAGAVALMFQANPELTPNLVKSILTYTAQPLSGGNTLEQGAGQLNVDGAVRMAKLVKTTLPTTNGAALLSASLPASQTSTVSGQTISWGRGVITNYGFLHGSELMTKWQGMYGSGVLMSDSTPYSNGQISKLASLVTNSVNLFRGAISNSGVLMSDGVLVADGVLLADGVLMGDGVLVADGTLVSDGILVGDNTPRGDQAALGDNTACMLPAP
jgi:subtilisin family serine protease